jgi:hypothetical protein
MFILLIFLSIATPNGVFGAIHEQSGFKDLAQCEQARKLVTSYSSNWHTQAFCIEVSAYRYNR